LAYVRHSKAMNLMAPERSGAMLSSMPRFAQWCVNASAVHPVLRPYRAACANYTQSAQSSSACFKTVFTASSCRSGG